MTSTSSLPSIVPPLENGDSPRETLRERPTRQEFECRYHAMYRIKKW